MSTSTKKGIIIYDGHCFICNRFLTAVLSKNGSESYVAIPLQIIEQVDSFPFKDQISRNPKGQYESILFVIDNKIYDKSTAAILILSNLGSWRKIYKLLFIFPQFLRDYVYNIISRNRYKWFGQSENCQLPDDKLKSKYIMSEEEAVRRLAF